MDEPGVEAIKTLDGGLEAPAGPGPSPTEPDSSAPAAAERLDKRRRLTKADIKTFLEVMERTAIDEGYLRPGPAAKAIGRHRQNMLRARKMACYRDTLGAEWDALEAKYEKRSYPVKDSANGDGRKVIAGPVERKTLPDSMAGLIRKEEWQQEFESRGGKAAVDKGFSFLLQIGPKRWESFHWNWVAKNYATFMNSLPKQNYDNTSMLVGSVGKIDSRTLERLGSYIALGPQGVAQLLSETQAELEDLRRQYPKLGEQISAGQAIEVRSVPVP